jgi:hypothetical protein
MKLKDKGTNLNPAVQTKKPFKGKEYLVLKATYDEKLERMFSFYFESKDLRYEVLPVLP